MSPKHALLKLVYEAFNARDIERALSGLHRDVEWANGMEGGSVQGPNAVRDYWTRQWRLIDPRVHPEHYEGEGDQVVVNVHQVVCDLEGRIISDQMVRHSFEFADELIKVFKIL
jgi:ketosteroid isomerase-like protein